MATLVLLVFAGIFAYLAYDAHKVGSRVGDLTSIIEDQMQGQSLVEKARMKEWARTQGIGNGAHMKWIFILISTGCFLAAILRT